MKRYLVAIIGKCYSLVISDKISRADTFVLRLLYFKLEMTDRGTTTSKQHFQNSDNVDVWEMIAEPCNNHLNQNGCL